MLLNLLSFSFPLLSSPFLFFLCMFMKKTTLTCCLHLKQKTSSNTNSAILLNSLNTQPKQTRLPRTSLTLAINHKHRTPRIFDFPTMNQKAQTPRISLTFRTINKGSTCHNLHRFITTNPNKPNAPHSSLFFAQSAKKPSHQMSMVLMLFLNEFSANQPENVESPQLGDFTEH